MPETIKRISIDDIQDKLAEWKTHNSGNPKYIIVNDIDIYDFQKSIMGSGATGGTIKIFGITIVRSSDIPHGEIYVV